MTSSGFRVFKGFVYYFLTFFGPNFQKVPRVKPKNIQFTITEDEENHRTVTPANIWHLCLKKLV